jgi:hypothetical protein
MKKLKANQDQLVMLLSSNLQIINLLSMELRELKKKDTEQIAIEWYEKQINKLIDLQVSVQG